ncbi:MAG: hypothetical protein AAF679_02075 [Pseudomonadota bacterium]
MIDEAFWRLALNAFQHPSFIGTGAGVGLSLFLGKLRRGKYFWLSLLAIGAIVQVALVWGMIYAFPLTLELCAPNCAPEQFWVIIPISALFGLFGAFGLGALRVRLAPKVYRDPTEPFR